MSGDDEGVRRRHAIHSLLAMAFAAAATAPLGAQSRDPFATDARTYEWSGIYLVESWNKNLSTDQLAGALFTAGATWAHGWQGITEFGLQRGSLGNERDPLFVTVTGGVRRLIARRGCAAFYLEGLFGIAIATRHVPRGGSSFNWIGQGGGGVLWTLGERSYLVTGARVFHLSNGGLYGDGRNPDLETIGGYAGLGVTF